MQYNVEFIYKSVHPEPLSVEFHTHSCYEMVLYIAGGGTVETEENSYEYEPGCAVVVAPGVRHNEVNRLPSRNIVVGFSCCAGSEAPTGGAYHDMAQFEPMFSSILSEAVEQRKYYKEMLSFELGRVILELLRRKSDSGEDRSFVYILNYIEENLSMPISIDGLAALSSYSSGRFRHIFREKMGIAPKEYVMARRIEKAKQLLTSSDKSVTEISLDCGFYDCAHFCRAFHEQTGAAPIKYRRESGRESGTLL